MTAQIEGIAPRSPGRKEKKNALFSFFWGLIFDGRPRSLRAELVYA